MMHFHKLIFRVKVKLQLLILIHFRIDSVNQQFQQMPKRVKEQTVLGNAIFSSQADKRTINKINPVHKEILKSQICWITADDFYPKWKKIFTNMTRSTHTHLRIIVGELSETIFSEIGHVDFENLIQLNLLNNRIQNIEALAFLNAPKLQKISFVQNQIVNISSTLGKLYFPNLVMIDCSFNQVNQIDLGRLKIRKDEGNVRLLKYAYATFMAEDISFYAKSMATGQSEKMRQYISQYQHGLSNFDNIKQAKCSQVLKRKFEKPLIFQS